MVEKEAKGVLPEAERTKRKEGEFPPGWEERLGALLASFNFGPKAATFLLLPKDGYISPEDLTSAFRQIHQGTEMEKTVKKTAPEYCHQTLCPIGMVAEEYTIDFWGVEKLVGFGLTEAGKKYGLPAASLALDFEKRRPEISLFPLFGQTGTSSPEGRRAPQTRAKILLELSQAGGPLREADLCQKLNLKVSLVKSSLQALQKAGVINYEAVTTHTGKTQVSYQLGKLPPGEIEPYGGYSNLTNKIFTLCQALAEEQREITPANVWEKIGEETKGQWKEKNLMSKISGILSHLAAQGYLVRGKFKGGEVLSQAEINEKGRLVVEEILLPLLGLVRDEPATREKIDRIAARVRDNLPSYARNSAGLYYPHSQSFKIKESQANRAKTREILFLDGPQGVTAQELAAKIGLDQVTIRRYLAILRENGQARRERRKGVDYYFSLPQAGRASKQTLRKIR